jgi:hypothetical protein
VVVLLLLAPALSLAQQPAPFTLREGRFTVVAYPSEARLARTILASAIENDTFPGLARPAAPATIMLAPDAATFREWVGPASPEWGIAVAFPGEGRVILQGRRAGTEAGDPRQTVRHELAHLALYEALGGNVPRWFSEGYASYAAGEWGREELLATSLALVVRGAPSVDEIEGWFLDGPSRVRTAYALSHRAVAEMAALDPERGLTLFLQYWRDTGSMDAAMRRAFGLTLAGFDQHWGRRTQLRYGALALVGNLTLAVGVMGFLVLPLYLIRRRRYRARMEALRQADATAERLRLAELQQLLGESTGESVRNGGQRAGSPPEEDTLERSGDRSGDMKRDP